VVQEGIKFLKKGTQATAGASKKTTVRQRRSAMRDKESESRQKK